MNQPYRGNHDAMIAEQRFETLWAEDDKAVYEYGIAMDSFEADVDQLTTLEWLERVEVLINTSPTLSILDAAAALDELVYLGDQAFGYMVEVW